MASKTSAPARSAEIEVTDLAQSRGIAAAWRGIYHFFGGRVQSWEFVPPTDENPDGGLIAHGFSVLSSLDPNQIVSDIGNRDRRLEMFPFYFYANGTATPPDFLTSQDMTNFMVQYLKGAVEEGTAKTPEYVRKAVADYKAANGLRTRRGPKRKIIRLDNLAELDATQLSEIDPAQLQDFLKLAQSIVSKTPATTPTNSEGVAASS